MLKADLVAEVAKIKWFHTINLGQGVVTPGIDDSPAKLKTLGFPRDLRGKSVLDIGAWDAFFSFEAERRGASRVLATDSFCWSGPSWGTQDGFKLARRALDSKVEDLEIEVLDISPERAGKFDVVLFLGVLYYMRHPLLALEKIASVTEPGHLGNRCGFIRVRMARDEILPQHGVAWRWFELVGTQCSSDRGNASVGGVSKN